MQDASGSKLNQNNPATMAAGPASTMKPQAFSKANIAHQADDPHTAAEA